MERLFIFFYNYRAFFTFLILEVACGWMIISNNQYQGASFFNSSNSIIAGLNTFSQGVREYFLLRNINSTLAEENAYLRSKLEQRNQAMYTKKDTASQVLLDSAVITQYDFISAKVVANTVHRFTNYLTINKGSVDSIRSGMAVISPLGAVGKVKSVSKHFSVVTSILHIDVQVSVLLKKTGDFGTAQWDGKDASYIKLKYIPTHVSAAKGDTIVTSGYNAVYPEGVMIGVIEEIERNETLFYDITVRLSQDFRKLSYVEVVKSNLKDELDSLQSPFVEAEK
ncbi:rod shape-determining protein MreC [Chryseosolibacter indicus]|uniref:Cell shape-determining protein MreC n=1 Tax=Chryseosolibacter indicus TaxID=2782351 RepID=A0ABS5VNJ6_9BACT|nr:rod shape-determining protein MreC [Chryseosolibacter indicus]MBT1703022.1 rod shape-determining protein MreC [Chryseosolibacter indicus]